LSHEDTVLQRAVLTFVISNHPNLHTQGELTRILAADPEDAAQRDAVIRAVGELAGAGLLSRKGHYVAPTRAALYFDRLSACA